MKLILLQALSGPSGTHDAGDEINVSDKMQAVSIIEKGIAKAKTKKENDALLEDAAKLKREAAEQEAKARAILEKEVIELELRELYGRVADKEAELAGEVLDDAQRKKMVKSLENREK